MEEMPNVVVVLARCISTGDSFGIRVEEIAPEAWKADWAFAIKEDQAKKEGYHKNEISGEFAFAKPYPGCPYCERKALVRCSCGTVYCWDGDSKDIDCSICGKKRTIRGPVTRLNTVSDR